MSSLRLHRLLLMASILVPAAVFVAAAAWNRMEVTRESTETVARTDAILHEHARKVFDTVDLVLGRVDDRVKAMSWAEIASPETSAFLRTLKEPLEQAVSIWVTDATGHVQAGSQDWDRHVGIGDREWFVALRDKDVGTYFSSAFSGRATRTPSFAVARRRSTPDGHFDGIIHVALSPDYFSRFIGEAAPSAASAGALLREDGEVLARYPSAPPSPHVRAGSAIMRAIAEKPDAGSLEGVSTVDQHQRRYAYRRVAPYPLYVVFGLDEAEIRSRWLRNVEAYGAVAVLSILVLFGVSAVALQRAKAEQDALLKLKAESDQRIAAEQRLLQAQKMESLGQLTGGIAHDFNNLLSVIIGNLDLAGRRLKHDPKVARLLDTAMQGAQRGASLTQRLLAFSRRQELAPQSVRVPDLVAGLTDLLSRSLGPNIMIETRVPSDLPPVLVDPNQLEMALVNLAVNARDAMRSGGTIAFSASAHVLGDGNANGLPPGRYVRIDVRDTGAGMDAPTLSRAVEPFFTTKGVGKGTGLGLSMIHGFAVQSKGALQLRSVPGEGTTASIWLPESHGEELAAASPAEVFPDQPACTVLLVEDDPLVMAGTAAMLDDLGHHVHEAVSGEAALSLLDETTVDLVVTDQSMPGMTGAELAQRIRAKFPSLPVLIATGNMDLASSVGAEFPRLNKPYRRHDLAVAIASLLGDGDAPAATRRTGRSHPT
jgi:signal transduction histidine kinase/CheY-like chemotaxis protein